MSDSGSGSGGDVTRLLAQWGQGDRAALDAATRLVYLELHKIATAQLLTGTDQTALTSLSDWCALQPVRWINEQSNGGWRYIPYATAMGRNATTMNSLPDWGQQMTWWHDDSPAGTSGPWMSTGDFPHIPTHRQTRPTA